MNKKKVLHKYLNNFIVEIYNKLTIIDQIENSTPPSPTPDIVIFFKVFILQDIVSIIHKFIICHLQEFVLSR